MALFTGTVKLVDEHGLTTTKTATIQISEIIHATRALQVMAAYAELAQFAGKLDNVSDLMVLDASLNVSVMEDVTGLKGSPGEQGAAEGAYVLLGLEAGAGGLQVNHPYWIPGAKEGIFMAGFKLVDITDADLQDFFEEFNDPIGDIGAKIVVSDNQSIDTNQGVSGLISGYYATKQRSAK